MFKILLKTPPRGARNENPPFPRGSSFYNGAPIDVSNLPTSLGGSQLVGKEWEFEDISPNVASPTQRTNSYVRARMVRWLQPAFNALPGFICNYYTSNTYATVPSTPGSNTTTQAGIPSAGNEFAHSDGFTDTTAQDFLGVIDEYLPAAGVPQYDIFWAVVEGPTAVMTPLDGGSDNVFALNQRVVALTAATSGAVTAGRVIAQSILDSSTIQGVANAAQVQNVIGRALFAATTGNTNASLLVYVTDR